MDIYSAFDLPSPPSPTRTMFSSTSDLRLPNFTSVAQVAEFVDAAVVWRFDQQMDTFMIFTVVVKITIEVALSLYLVIQICKRAWWMFRLVARPRGNRIVPNVHASWTLAIGTYGYTLIVFLILIHVNGTNNKPVPFVGLWLSLTWAPIPFAAWYQVWGISATRRENLTGAVYRWTDRLPAAFIDTLLMALPIFPGLAAIYPCVLANRHLEEARRRWYGWHIQYDDATQLDRDMLAEAQATWTDVIQGCYFLSIVFCIWAMTCAILMSLYVKVSFDLVSELRRHVLNVNRPHQHTSLHPASTTVSLRTETSTTRGSLFLRPSPREEKLHVNTRDQQPSDTTDSFDDEAALQCHLFSEVEIERDISTAFFPPIAPSASIVSIQAKEAQSVLFWYRLQAISVGIGGLIYTSTSTLMLVALCTAAENGTIVQVLNPFFALVCAVSIIIGATTSLSITHGTFEASFAALLTVGRKDSRVAPPSPA